MLFAGRSARGDVPRVAGYAALPLIQAGSAARTTRKGGDGLRREGHKLLSVLIVRAVVYIMFADDSDSLLKPHICPSAAAKMIAENMNPSPDHL